jgi:hypothetical protein
VRSCLEYASQRAARTSSVRVNLAWMRYNQSMTGPFTRAALVTLQAATAVSAIVVLGLWFATAQTVAVISDPAAQYITLAVVWVGFPNLVLWFNRNQPQQAPYRKSDGEHFGGIGADSD